MEATEQISYIKFLAYTKELIDNDTLIFMTVSNSNNVYYGEYSDNKIHAKEIQLISLIPSDEICRKFTKDVKDYIAVLNKTQFKYNNTHAIINLNYTGNKEIFNFIYFSLERRFIYFHIKRYTISVLVDDLPKEFINLILDTLKEKKRRKDVQINAINDQFQFLDIMMAKLTEEERLYLNL